MGTGGTVTREDIRGGLTISGDGRVSRRQLCLRRRSRIVVRHISPPIRVHHHVTPIAGMRCLGRTSQPSSRRRATPRSFLLCLPHLSLSRGGWLSPVDFLRYRHRRKRRAVSVEPVRVGVVVARTTTSEPGRRQGGCRAWTSPWATGSRGASKTESS